MVLAQMPEQRFTFPDDPRRAAAAAARPDPRGGDEIDDLMRRPVKGLPSIVVLGDESVFGITPFPQDG